MKKLLFSLFIYININKTYIYYYNSYSYDYYYSYDYRKVTWVVLGCELGDVLVAVSFFFDG